MIEGQRKASLKTALLTGLCGLNVGNSQSTILFLNLFVGRKKF